jgi:hypothetical protein
MPLMSKTACPANRIITRFIERHNFYHFSAEVKIDITAKIDIQNPEKNFHFSGKNVIMLF